MHRNDLGSKKRVDGYCFYPVNKLTSKGSVFEIDGYEWHNSKEAFINDRQRDRELNKLNYQVYRYTGLEIYNDLESVARDALDKLKTSNTKQF